MSDKKNSCSKNGLTRKKDNNCNNYFKDEISYYDNTIPKEVKNFVINIPNFQERVLEHIKKISNSIECTIEQKRIILIKSEKILKTHIKKALKGEITIPKNANLPVITSAIIYTVIASNENMPNIMLYELADIINIDPAYISRYYRIHFNQLYPKKNTRRSLDDYCKEFQKLMTESNGKILELRRNKDDEIELKIECNECGNNWWKRPTHIKANKHWCRICGYYNMAKERRKYDIQFFKDLAIKRGLERTGFAGKCLSEIFLSVDKELSWECGACENKWRTRPHYILYDFSWCPKCQNTYTEEICRLFFENLFLAKFPKAKKGKFLWLVNDNGNFMELDGHNEGLRVAFESQGIQHYIPVKHFYKGNIEKFKRRLKDDKKKRELTNQNDYKLIAVGYEWKNGKLRKIKFSEMENYIRRECQKKGITIPNKNRINWKEFQIRKFCI
ncbi:hypothetical protein LCGC14_1958220 [marine sediment metagenome]|uniref:Uncharacterized protein n=1 Tax=marine sediment metagenome TaxID=412755 RepID=A0A0F9HTQ6_9ZZZZ